MPSSIPTVRDPRPLRRARALAASALLAIAAAAQAESVGVTTHDLTATLGGTATVVFDFDFHAQPNFTSFGALVDYDPGKLVLLQNVVTVLGVPTDPAAYFAPADYHTAFDAAHGHVSVLWLPLSNPLAVVPASGTAQWAFTYRLAAGFTAPGSSTVTLDFTFSDVNGDDGLVNGAPRSPQSSTISVAAVTGAVPEPEPWALTLAGLGLVFLRFGRTRWHARADAP